MRRREVTGTIRPFDHGLAKAGAGLPSTRGRITRLVFFLMLALCDSQLRGQAGNISTVFGPTISATGVTSTLANLEPMGVALDSNGALYTADIQNCVVWKTTFANAAGTTTLFAGMPGQCAPPVPTSAQADPTKNVLLSPTAIAICGSNVYIATHGFDTVSTVKNFAANTVGGSVYRVDANGIFTDLGLKSIDGNGAKLYPLAIACRTDSSQVEHVYVSSYWFGPAEGGSPIAAEVDELTSTGTGWSEASLNHSDSYIAYTAIAIEEEENSLYGLRSFVDGYQGWVGPEVFSAGGLEQLSNGNTQIGNGVHDGPSGLATDSNGNFFLSVATVAGRYSSEVIFEPPSGSPTTILAGDGTLGFVDNVPGPQAELNSPQGIAVDSSGNVYIADALNNRVRRIEASSVTIAPMPSTTTVSLASASVTSSGSDTATATITPGAGVASVSGTVSFISKSTVTLQSTLLCASSTVHSVSNAYQAVCAFTAPAAGSYTVIANYSGDAQNLSSSGSAALAVTAPPPPLPGVGNPGTPLAISQNNSSSSLNAVLNADSSVDFIQNAAVVANQSCPVFPGLGSMTGGAIYFDKTNSRVFLTAFTKTNIYETYETVGQGGSCTQAPLVSLGLAFGTFEMNVDPVQGNIYVLIATQGGTNDTLSILPTAPWSVASPPVPVVLSLDYSATYGPILIDPSNHQVYIDDLGSGAYGAPGIYAAPGFFVFDPTHSTTPASNLQLIAGYLSGGVATAFNAAALLTNGAGELVLVNENITPSADIGTPLTILDTTKFSFFNNTSLASNLGKGVNITPGTGISQVAATAKYNAVAGADIDAANNVVYAYGYNVSQSTPVDGSGTLLQYNLAGRAGTPETVLANNLALPTLYQSSGPWDQLTYDPISTELVVSTISYGETALGISSPLCAGSPVTLTQLAGNAGASALLGLPSVNAISGYVYVAEGSDVAYIAPPLTGCSSAGSIHISPATVPVGTVNSTYSQQFTANGGSGGYMYTETGTLPTGIAFSGSALTGRPTQAGTFPFSITVRDSQGNTANQTYSLVIGCAALSIVPASGALPAASIGLLYDQGFLAVGTTGALTWMFSGDLPQGVSFVGGTTASVAVTGKAAPPTGNPSFTLTATDSTGCQASSAYSIEVYNELIVAPATLPNATVGQAYASSFRVSNGTGPFTYFTLATPPGLALNTQTGALTGTPTQAGFFTVTVLATDSSNGAEGVIAASLTVAQGAALQITDNETIIVSDNTPSVLLIDLVDNETITVSDNTPSVLLVDVSDNAESITVTDTVTITVKSATATILTGALSSGNVLTLTATVQPATSGTPTGTATFYAGMTALGVTPLTMGVASLSINALPPGVQTITAVYSGDASFTASTSNPITELIADFNLVFSSPTQVILPGQSATFMITATPVGGSYDAPITFSVSGLPAGATATFSSTSVTPGSSSVSATLTIQSPPPMTKMERPRIPGYSVPVLLGLMLPLVGLARARRKTQLRRFWFIVVALAGVMGLSGCAGGGFFDQPVKSYTVMVTGTSGSLHHSATVVLTVQ